MSSLFNDVSKSDTVTSNGGIISEDELECMWKDAVVALFKVFVWGAEENDKSFIQDSWCPD
jgi:hypothetical protein